MKLNATLLKSTVVAALGGLLFGFDTAVISGTTSALTQTYSLTPFLLGVTVFSALFGTVLGAMLAGIPGERFGRRDSLRVMAVLYLISGLGCAFAWNWYALVIFRFIGGLGVGGSSVLGPMYIAEIAPAKLRGRLVGVFQFNVVFGILVAYFSNYVISLQHFGATEWRWELGVTAIPAALFFVMLFTIPRSPRWLVKKGRVDEAREVLQATGDENYEHDLQEIVASIGEEQSQAAEKLFSRKFAFPIFLAVSIGMFNQLSGINAILYYLNDIFGHAGFSKVSGNLQAVAIGATNLLFTMIAMSVIDRLGRKTLLLVGSVGTAVCLAGVSVIFFTGPAPEPSGLAAGRLHRVFRILPGRRHLGLPLGSFSQFRARQGPEPGKLLALVHECCHLSHLSADGRVVGRLSLRVFRRDDGAAVLCVLFVYPETKGLSLEEMQKKLGIS